MEGFTINMQISTTESYIKRHIKLLLFACLYSVTVSTSLVCMEQQDHTKELEGLASLLETKQTIEGMPSATIQRLLAHHEISEANKNRHGFNVKNGYNSRNDLKETLLITLIRRGFNAAAKLLILYGADVNIKHEGKYLKGRTPLMYAARSDEPDYELVALLLHKGAQIDDQDDLVGGMKLSKDGKRDHLKRGCWDEDPSLFYRETEEEIELKENISEPVDQKTHNRTVREYAGLYLELLQDIKEELDGEIEQCRKRASLGPNADEIKEIQAKFNAKKFDHFKYTQMFAQQKMIVNLLAHYPDNKPEIYQLVQRISMPDQISKINELMPRDYNNTKGAEQRRAQAMAELATAKTTHKGLKFKSERHYKKYLENLKHNKNNISNDPIDVDSIVDSPSSEQVGPRSATPFDWTEVLDSNSIAGLDLSPPNVPSQPQVSAVQPVQPSVSSLGSHLMLQYPMIPTSYVLPSLSAYQSIPQFALPQVPYNQFLPQTFYPYQPSYYSALASVQHANPIVNFEQGIALAREYSRLLMLNHNNNSNNNAMTSSTLNSNVSNNNNLNQGDSSSVSDPRVAKRSRHK